METRVIAVLDRHYRLGERLAAYDLAALVRRDEDGMEEWVRELEEYCARAFADLDGEPDRCRLEMLLRWEEAGICCPHGPARIVARRDLCESCRHAVEGAGATPVTIEVREFDPDRPPQERYCGYCSERLAFVVVGPEDEGEGR